jgi:pimeloyl-ACP methyl ester carboxylesterase
VSLGVSSLLVHSLLVPVSGNGGWAAAGLPQAHALARVHLVADRLPLERSAPVVVLVHGFNAGPGVFDGIAPGLARRGLQVVRFRYDDGASLERSADAFVRAVRTLRGLCSPASVAVIGHSMGGLVARRAMTVGRAETLAEPGGRPLIRLITVASPFGGFRLANPTRVRLLRILAVPFGGRKSFVDLASGSGFIRRPGALGANVAHFKTETHEEGQTRLDGRGRRASDTVARRRNQRNPLVDSDARVRIVSVDAGHLGVLDGQAGAPPVLWAALEASGLFP